MTLLPDLSLIQPATKPAELPTAGIMRSIDGLTITLAHDGLHIQGLASANSTRKRSVWIDCWDAQALITFFDSPGARELVAAHWTAIQNELYLESFTSTDKPA